MEFLKINIHNYYSDFEKIEFKVINNEKLCYIYPQIKQLEEDPDEKIVEILNEYKDAFIEFDLKNPVINPLGFVSMDSGDFEINYSIKFNQEKVGVFIYIPGINDNLLESFEMESDISENSISFSVFISWDNIFKKFDEKFPKNFYQNFKPIKEKEISLYTVKIPFNEYKIEQDSLKLIKVLDGIIYIELDLLKPKKISYKKGNL